jgi:hypothetical protein
MPRGGGARRLRLGPVVGHTDHRSTRVWIRTFDDPGRYQLRVQGAGVFPFTATESGALEFRTGVATATGLRPDWTYRFTVLHRGRVVPGARGGFRTMPPPGSMADVVFCAISCSKMEEGLWERFSRFVEEAKPHFVLMMGDQVYIDEDEPDVHQEHARSPRDVRRAALAEKYQLNWSRAPVRKVMASVPTYMMWDDHDIRDGWGSRASDSPTLRQHHPRGEAVFTRSNTFFEDARDVYWHFQACRNPMPEPDQELPNYVGGPPPPGERRAMPFAFRCGRTVVLALDSRGDRDFFREEYPVLGAEQWDFIRLVLEGLREDVEALAIMTPTPIASLDPHGQSQKMLGDRTDDVEAFRRGLSEGRPPPDWAEVWGRAASGILGDVPLTVANVHLSRIFGAQLNLGAWKLSNLDEVRDQWSHKSARPEQAELLRMAGAARLTGAVAGSGRGLIFLSGDIHIGCIFDISSRRPPYKAPSLTSSGISAQQDDPVYVSVYVDEDFEVAPGVRSTLREVVSEYNFGVVQVVNTGTGAQITPILAHEGVSTVLGVNLAALL